MARVNQIYVEAVIVWSLYGLLIAVNFWYFLARAVRLTQTRFHVLMSLLLFLCFLCYVTEWALIVAERDATLAVLCYNFYYALNSIAHGIFVMKYWVLSRKILQVTTNSIDHNLHKKEIAIYTLLILIITSTVGAHIVLTLKEIRTKEWGNRIFKFFLSAPPIMIVIIFAHALYSLRKHEGSDYTISKG